MQDDYTPEEKLLKLITNSKAPIVKKDMPLEKVDPPGRMQSDLSVTIPSSIVSKSPSFFRYSIALLAVVNIIACLLLVYQYIFKQPISPYLRSMETLTREQHISQPVNAEQIDEKHVMNIFSKREIFKTYI
ncbi:MAG: hypothetical protein Q8Q33_09800, partial [Chlamydiota bacterium]|nr:hypothetical protein [Chlamydiota bacterium]